MKVPVHKVLRQVLKLVRYSTGHFIMFSMITNIYKKKTKGPTLMELLTATGKTEIFFLTTRDV
jgi:tRNA A37 methylthiotransferase MiaB